MSAEKDLVAEVTKRRVLDFTEMRTKMDRHLDRSGPQLPMDEIVQCMATLCDNLVEMCQDIATLQEKYLKG